MLELRLIRENPALVKKDLQRRGDQEKVAWVEELLRADENWRKLLTDANNLRERRNKLTLEISKLRKKGENASAIMREAEAIPERIKEVERDAEAQRERVDYYLLRLPNIMHESVPFGKDESENVEVRRWGTPPKLVFTPKDHIDLALTLDLVDLERAAKVAGARFYYLKNDLVRLNYALISYALDQSVQLGFTLFQPPYMIRRAAIGGAVALSDFEDVIYKIEGEDLYLLPTAEHALLAMHMDEILDGKQLPRRYGGVSPCFRKEAGAHGRDTKGIFRVHQFEKVEQFIFCRPEDSWKQHEILLENAEKLFQALKIPYRIVNVCTGDLGTVAAKKYDLEAWFPGQAAYREVVSCSNCTAYQGVRSNIRYRDRPDEPTRFVHTLNSTLVATERALAAIMENCQQGDGSIMIPEALRPYMNAQDSIKKPSSVQHERR